MFCQTAIHIGGLMVLRSPGSSLPFVRRAALIAAFAGSLALGGASLAQAQDATPAGGGTASIAGVPLKNTDGLQIGTVMASETNGEVTFTIIASTLTPGEHGVHIHETGTCDPADGFKSAGEHFNPENQVHGSGQVTTVYQVQPTEDELATPQAEASPAATPVPSATSHAGDLGNITVGDAGSVSVTITTSSVTLIPGAGNSLSDADGSALVIHADADDLHTDPSGNSGDRIACAVLYPPIGGGPATPAASPAADLVANRA